MVIVAVLIIDQTLDQSFGNPILLILQTKYAEQDLIG